MSYVVMMGNACDAEIDQYRSLREELSTKVEEIARDIVAIQEKLETAYTERQEDSPMRENEIDIFKK